MLSRRLVVFGLLLGSLVAALVTGRELFYNLTYLWGAVIIIAVIWAWTSVRQQSFRLGRASRALRAYVGRPLEERLMVRNLSSIPKLWVEVRDFSDLPGHEASQVVDSLGGKQQRVWVVRTMCRERGRFRLGPMALTSGDPFGLFQHTITIQQTNYIVVYPMTFELPGFDLPLGPMPGGDALRRRTHQITANASGVRDYAPGDAFNRIHWRSTARRDRLIVKEFELDPLSDIWLFLDGNQSMHVAAPPPDDFADNPIWPGLSEAITLPPSTEEYAVSLTASLAQHFVRRDRAVGLMAYGQAREMIQPDRGERQLTKLLETLAVFRAQGTVHLSEALALESNQLPRWTTLIIVTAAWDTQWVVSAQSLKRHGLRVVAVVIDPATFGSFQSSRSAVEALLGAGIPSYVVKQGDDFTAALSVASWATRRLELS